MPRMNKVYRPMGGPGGNTMKQKPSQMKAQDSQLNRRKQLRDAVNMTGAAQKMDRVEQAYKGRNDKIRQNITKRPASTTPSVNNMTERRSNRVMWANKLGYNPNKKMGNGASTLMVYQLPTWKQIKANPGYTGPKGPGKRSARARTIKKNIAGSTRFL